MKKTYITPNIHSVTVMPYAILAASAPNAKIDFTDGDEYADPDSEVL